MLGCGRRPVGDPAARQWPSDQAAESAHRRLQPSAPPIGGRTPTHPEPSSRDRGPPMAIINTFAKCLDSPYLFEDKDAAGPASARCCPGRRPPRGRRQHQPPGRATRPTSRFLSYEAMFACLRALVYQGLPRGRPALPAAGLRGTLRPARPARRRPHPRLRAGPGPARPRPPRPRRRLGPHARRSSSVAAGSQRRPALSKSFDSLRFNRAAAFAIATLPAGLDRSAAADFAEQDDPAVRSFACVEPYFGRLDLTTRDDVRTCATPRAGQPGWQPAISARIATWARTARRRRRCRRTAGRGSTTRATVASSPRTRR